MRPDDGGAAADGDRAGAAVIRDERVARFTSEHVAAGLSVVGGELLSQVAGAAVASVP